MNISNKNTSYRETSHLSDEHANHNTFFREGVFSSSGVSICKDHAKASSQQFVTPKDIYERKVIDGTDLFPTKGKVCLLTIGYTASPDKISFNVSVKFDNDTIIQAATMVVHENVFKHKQSLVKALAAKCVFLTKQDAMAGSKKAIQEWHKNAQVVAQDNYRETMSSLDKQKKEAFAKLNNL